MTTANFSNRFDHLEAKMETIIEGIEDLSTRIRNTKRKCPCCKTNFVGQKDRMVFSTQKKPKACVIFLLAGKLELLAHLDTGSNTSFLNKKTFEALDPESINNKRVPSGNYLDAKGNKVDFLCEIKITCQIDEKKVEHPFLVAKTNDYPNTIGLDFLTTHSAKLEVDEEGSATLSFA